MSKFKFNIGDEVTDSQGQRATVLGRFRMPKVADNFASPEFGGVAGNRVYVLAYRVSYPCAPYGVYSSSSVFVWGEKFLTPVV